MTRIKRIYTDQISLNPLDPCHLRAILRSDKIRKDLPIRKRLVLIQYLSVFLNFKFIGQFLYFFPST
jgi:hypothetical protein